MVIALRLGLLYHQREIFYDYDWRTKWEVILLALALSIGGRIVAGVIWADIMNRLGSNVPLLSHIQHYCTARILRRIPGKIWFIVGRGYLYSQDGDSFGLVAIASAIEFAITLLSGVIVVLFTISYAIFDLSNPAYYVSLAAIAGFSILCIHPRTIAWLVKRAGLADVPNLSYGTLLKWLVSYMIIWVIGGLMLYLVANIVIDVPYLHIGYIIGSWCLISIFSLVTIAIPTNLGINDIGLGLLLMSILPSSLAAVIAVLFYLLALLYEFIGFLIIISTIYIIRNR